MGRLIYLLTVVIVILAVIDVLRSNQEIEKKLLWIAVIILLPLLGALAWYAVSRRIINI